MAIVERLGVFYVGRQYDLEARKRLETPVMLDARELVTHAVCVGMTGSGKTGLCIDLLEEAALDRVPAIVVDPKGDICNLLLTFPQLSAQDFEPWVNVDDAGRKGMTVEAYARSVADLWAKGLAEWDQGPERIALLKDSVDFGVYTPGSDAGLPISILSSFKAWPGPWDDEVVRERIQSTVTALLDLAGIPSDPLRSREHILLSSIMEHFWRQGRDADLASLITAVRNPPVTHLGVFAVDDVFPAKDRNALALALNNVVASPSFSSWLQGEPLEVQSLLYDPSGKPRHSIFYLAHLSEAERMFFVTLLLEQVVAWVRAQPGTTSLRALLYFDELYGFLPPTAAPPSKKPLLTLLKQARASGLGVLLCTQNPADLDYKALSNAGTWFVGRLQAERDKMRILEGLESMAGQGVDRPTYERIISGLSSRIFLMHSVYLPQPIVFETRWAMSYLRGPLTRAQVRTLMAPRRRPSVPPKETVSPMATPSRDLAGYARAAPLHDVPMVWFPVRLTAEAAAQRAGCLGEGATLVYDPGFFASATVRFVEPRAALDLAQELAVFLPQEALDPMPNWEMAQVVPMGEVTLQSKPEPQALWATLPPRLSTSRGLKALERDLLAYLAGSRALTLWYNPTLRLWSRPDESEAQFKVRAGLQARERRDEELRQLQASARAQVERVEKQLEREELELAKDRARLAALQRQELLVMGQSILSVLGVSGRRRTPPLHRALATSGAAKAAQAEVAESEEAVARYRRELESVRRQIEEQAAAVAQRWAQVTDQVQAVVVRPRKTDLRTGLVAVAWVPEWVLRKDGGTVRVPAWR